MSFQEMVFFPFSLQLVLSVSLSLDASLLGFKQKARNEVKLWEREKGYISCSQGLKRDLKTSDGEEAWKETRGETTTEEMRWTQNNRATKTWCDRERHLSGEGVDGGERKATSDDLDQKREKDSQMKAIAFLWCAWLAVHFLTGYLFASRFSGKERERDTDLDYSSRASSKGIILFGVK